MSGFLSSIALAAMGAGALAAIISIRHREGDPFIQRIFLVAMAVKVIGTLARFYVLSDVYDGVGDANRYFRAGRALAAEIRSGSLPAEARETGTPFMEFLAGLAYVVLPPRLIFGFVLFSILSFIGAFLFLQAFRLAVPEGNHRLYATLVFFTPTMVFWPSTLDKEAWLVFSLGVATYGAARVLRRNRFGYAIAVAGGAAVFMVRPHMGALFALALAGASVLRFRDPAVRRALGGWLLGVIMIGVGAGYAFVNFADELPAGRGVEEATFDDIAAETIRRTTTGGSEFDSRPVRGPGDFVHAAITVPFRPFPTEGHNMQAQLAGLEGIVLILLCLIFLPRLVGLPRAILRLPYVAMASAYSVGFIIAFSNVGNFGILTRQRAQLLPFLFVLMAYDWHRRRDERGPLLVPKDGLADEPKSPAARASIAVLRTEIGARGPLVATSASELVIDLPDGAIDHRAPPAQRSTTNTSDP